MVIIQILYGDNSLPFGRGADVMYCVEGGNTKVTVVVNPYWNSKDRNNRLKSCVEKNSKQALS